MVRTPERLTLRPLTFADDIAAGSEVYVRRCHVDQSFYTPAVVTNTSCIGMARDGNRVPAAAPGDRSVLAGWIRSVTARDERGHEATHSISSSRAVLDAWASPKPGRWDGAVREEWVRGVLEHRLAVPAEPSHPDAFDALLTPVWGAEVNLRLMVKDGNVDTIAAQISTLLTEQVPGLRVAHSEAGLVHDLHVNVSEGARGENGAPGCGPERRIGTNVLYEDLVGFRCDTRYGPLSTEEVPYGADAVDG